MKKLWSGIRSILNVGKCKNSYITSILNNNKSVDNPMQSYVMQRRESPREVIAHHSTLGVTTQDQFFIPCHFV